MLLCRTHTLETKRVGDLVQDYDFTMTHFPHLLSEEVDLNILKFSFRIKREHSPIFQFKSYNKFKLTDDNNNPPQDVRAMTQRIQSSRKSRKSLCLIQNGPS